MSIDDDSFDIEEALKGSDAEDAGERFIKWAYEQSERCAALRQELATANQQNANLSARWSDMRAVLEEVLPFIGYEAVVDDIKRRAYEAVGRTPTV